MFCTVNDIQLYYELSGSGTPLLMVHGNSEDHPIFDAAVEELSKTHTVCTVDSRCHGRSTDTDEISYDRMADDLIGFIRALPLEKPVFYGFSDGGIIGLLIALKEPDLLGKLIISGANLNPEGLQEEDRTFVRKIAARGNKLFQMMESEPNISPADLSKITVPTVVLAGEHDMILPEHTRLIADSIPGSVLEILPGEDHSSYIVNSDKLAPLLKKYL